MFNLKVRRSPLLLQVLKTCFEGISKSKWHTGNLFTHISCVYPNCCFLLCPWSVSFFRGSHSTSVPVIMACSITHWLNCCLRLLFLLLWCQKVSINCTVASIVHGRLWYCLPHVQVCLCSFFFFFYGVQKNIFKKRLWLTASPFACHIAIKKLLW